MSPPWGQYVRIGKLLLPTNAFAWGLSIILHLSLGLGACLIWRAHVQGQWDLASSGGGAGALVTLAGGGDRPLLVSGLPDSLDPLPKQGEHAPDLPNFDASNRPDLSESSENRTLVSLAAEWNASDGPQVIGISSTDEVVRNGAIGKLLSRAASPPSGSSGSPQGAGLPAGEGAGFIPPGLPAELVRGGIPPPEYPPEAQRRRQQGLVQLELDILPDGQIGGIQIIRDPGFPLLRDAALHAAHRLRAHRFSPARQGRRPIRCKMTLPYWFVLR